MIIPKNDDRKYKVITLPNHLEITLISDPKADKAACAVDVNIGSFCDPPYLLGFAHYLEHMLFLGTEKYPDVQDYSSYLNENGGDSNAYTDDENTNYHFHVNANALEGALDRFSRFFVCPLFKRELAENEVNAVNSEHEKNIQRDNWRLQRLYETEGNPNHPYHKFSTGTYDTLYKEPRDRNIDVVQELVSFHKKYYSANLMKACISSNHSIEQLVKWSTLYFSDIENTNVRKPVFSQDAMGALPKRLNYKPIRDTNNLEIAWPLPPIKKYYQQKPDLFLIHLLGHESEGSILYSLKKLKYAHSLGVSINPDSSSFSCLMLSIELTDLGLQNADEIVCIVYQYISLIPGVEEWVFEEMQKLHQVKFDTKNRRHYMEEAVTIAENMHIYDSEHVLSGAYLISEWKPEYIIELVRYLVPNNMRICYINKNVTTDSTEKYYGIEYSSHSLDPKKLKRWNECVKSNKLQDLKLPVRNAFLPEDITPITVDDHEYPIKINKGVYLKSINKYNSPMVLVNLFLKSKSMVKSVDKYVSVLLYIKMLMKYIISDFYYMSLGGSTASIETKIDGIEITVYGFRDAVPKIMNLIFENLLKHSEIRNFRFEETKAKMIKDLRNNDLNEPYLHCYESMQNYLQRPSWSYKEMVAALSSLESVDVKFSDLKYRMLVVGNCDKKFCDMLPKIGKPDTAVYSQDVSVTTEPTFKKLNKIDKGNSNSAIAYCFACPDKQEHMLDLLYLMINENFYADLRTNQQLGYIVKCQNITVRGKTLMMFLIQWTNRADLNIDVIKDKIEKFIKTIPDQVEHFEEFKQALILMKEVKPINLGQEMTRYWNEIYLQEFEFDRLELEIHKLNKLNETEFKQFAATIMSSQPIVFGME